MSLIENSIHFIVSRSFLELLNFFWYFIFFDFFRYVLLDVVVAVYHVMKIKKGEKKSEKARAELFTQNPLVSVISPGKNEGPHLYTLAESIQKQTYKNIELIIIDDGSDDDTQQICQRLENSGLTTKFFRNSVRGGKASAANLALKYASGEYVIHMDADSHLKENSVEQIMIPFFLEDGVGAVGGDIRVKNVEHGLCNALQGIDYLKSISVGRTISSHLGILRIVAGAFGAFPMRILKRVGGWDVGPGLDGDLTYKIRKTGLKVVHEPGAVCYTNVPANFRNLAKQRFRWDRSLVRFRLRKHKDILSFKNKNFQMKNFLASLDNIIFNLVLNLKWWVYISHMMIFNSEHLLIIFIINYFLYFTSNLIEFTVALILLKGTLRKKDFLLAFFLPLTPLYTGIYLRLIRTYAYMMEILFKASYQDKWNPWKVSRTSRDLN